jgi:hypothetical protein
MNRWKEELLNDLLDYVIDEQGVLWTVQWLLDSGFTEEQLIKLGFAHEDIVNANKEDE